MADSVWSKNSSVLLIIPSPSQQALKQVFLYQPLTQVLLQKGLFASWPTACESASRNDKPKDLQLYLSFPTLSQ